MDNGFKRKEESRTQSLGKLPHLSGVQAGSYKVLPANGADGKNEFSVLNSKGAPAKKKANLRCAKEKKTSNVMEEIGINKESNQLNVEVITRFETQINLTWYDQM